MVTLDQTSQRVLLIQTLVTVGSGESRQTVTLSRHVMAAVRLTTGRTRRAALLPVHTRSAFWDTKSRCHSLNPDTLHFLFVVLFPLTVLTADPPEAWTTHTSSRLSGARVAVGTVLEAGLVTVAAPEAL